MKELLKTVEKNLQREYPETNPRLEYTIESTIMDSFVNNLLFSLGSINIPEILSGRSELEESLIMK